MTLKVIDRGWKVIKRDLRKLNMSFSKIGFPEETNVSGSRYEKFDDLLKAAVYNEFGTDKIPARSFMGASFDEKKRELLDAQARTYGAVIDQKMTPKQGLSVLGELGEKVVRTKIITLKTPPNAELTEKLKGFNDPLIHTGDMRDLVNHVEVVK